MEVRSNPGLALILPQAEAERAFIASEYPCRSIALRIHSSLQAVGFLAAITERLSDAGISVNAVSAFYHDHLFVPENRAGEAMELLATLGSALR
jgi:uncharacterized protein